ncbi:hypothetical protein [Streptomyces sp. 4F14]|uniref:hypothetical protein n=1 Tax=Streptomyces sp. 4F14 TaxID=3394380 RepID=UPI003A89BA53
MTLESLGRLMILVSPFRSEEGNGEVVDWVAAASDLAVPGFPADYREFVTHFGAGSLEDSLFLRIPRPGKPTEALTVGRIPQDTLESDILDSWSASDVLRKPDLRDMLLWGGTNASDSLFWITAGADPEQWPVAVWGRQKGMWAIYECGMVEFIIRLLRADFDECPISVTTLWGRGAARFLNLRDENRLWDEGIDPWEDL